MMKRFRQNRHREPNSDQFDAWTTVNGPFLAEIRPQAFSPARRHPQKSYKSQRLRVQASPGDQRRTLRRCRLDHDTVTHTGAGVSAVEKAPGLNGHRTRPLYQRLSQCSMRSCQLVTKSSRKATDPKKRTSRRGRGGYLHHVQISPYADNVCCAPNKPRPTPSSASIKHPTRPTAPAFGQRIIAGST